MPPGAKPATSGTRSGSWTSPPWARSSSWGTTVAEFLERMYVNRWRSLRAGRSRYGLMLREDGHVLDDGTTTRLDERRYYMTTTTGEHRHVLRHMEFHAQTVWPGLDVSIADVTDQWAGMALAGAARAARCSSPRRTEATANGPGSLPFMGALEATLAGIPVRVFPDHVLGRARLRDPRARRLGRRGLGAPPGAGRPARHRALRDRGDGDPAGREGTRGGGRRSTDARPPSISASSACCARTEVTSGTGGSPGRCSGRRGASSSSASGERRRSRPGAQLLDEERAARLGRQTTALTSLGHVTSAVHSPNLGAENRSRAPPGRPLAHRREADRSLPGHAGERSRRGVRPGVLRPGKRPGESLSP